MILGLAGPAESGKDTLAQFLYRNAKELGHDLLIRDTFAEWPKFITSRLLNLPLEDFYNNKDKLTHYTEQMLTGSGGTEPLTIRQLMQVYFEHLRRFNPSVFTDNVLSTMSHPKVFHVITDVRRRYEVEAIHQKGGKVIYLTKKTGQAPWRQHVTETEMEDDLSIYDAIIDNKHLTLEETKRELVNILRRWGWISTQEYPQ